LKRTASVSAASPKLEATGNTGAGLAIRNDRRHRLCAGFELLHNDGVRPNNDLDRIEWYAAINHQLGPRDSVFLETKYQDFRSETPSSTSTNVRQTRISGWMNFNIRGW